MRAQPVSAPVALQTTSYTKVIAFFSIIVLVIAGAGFAFYWFVIRSPEPKAPEAPVETPVETPAPQTPTSTPTPPAEQSAPAQDGVQIPTSSASQVEEAPATTTGEVFPFVTSTPVTAPPDGVRIPPPTSVTNELPPVQTPTPTTPTTTQASDADTDKDGLSDRREVELGLDATKADSDADGLTDGEEVLKYGTNPLNRDTDRDAYDDGVEIKNSFNPRGEGKCANPDCSL